MLLSFESEKERKIIEGYRCQLSCDLRRNFTLDFDVSSDVERQVFNYVGSEALSRRCVCCMHPETLPL